MTSSGSLYFPVWEQMKATWHVKKKKIFSCGREEVLLQRGCK